MYLYTKHLVNKRLYNIKPAKYFYNQKPSHLSLQEMLARAYFLYDIDANHLLCNLEHSVLALVYYKTTTNLLLLSELSILQLPGRHRCGWCSLEKSRVVNFYLLLISHKIDKIQTFGICNASLFQSIPISVIFRIWEVIAGNTEIIAMSHWQVFISK